MKRVPIICLALWLLAVSTVAFAQSGDELHAAANVQLVEDDKKLNAAYETLLKDIRDHNTKGRAEIVVERLRESQRAWLKYREAQIGFVGVYNEIGSSSARAGGLALYSHELSEARIQDFATVPNPF